MKAFLFCCLFVFTIVCNATAQRSYISDLDVASVNNTIVQYPFAGTIIALLVIIGVCLIVFVILLRVKVRQSTLKLLSSERKLREKNIQLQLAFEAGNIVPLVWNLKNNTISVSEKELKDKDDNFDKEMNKVTYQSLLDHVHPDDKDKVKQLFTDITINGARTSHTEVRYDVNRRYEDYYDVHFIYDNDFNGKVYGYMQKITQRKHNELTLKRNEAFLNEILDNIPMPIHVKDVKNGYIYRYWNKQSREMLGKAIFETAEKVVGKEAATEIENIDKRVYETGEKYYNNEIITTLDGRKYNTVVQKSVIFDGNDRLLLIARWDVGEIFELQNNLQIANKRNEIVLNNINAGLIYITRDYKVEWENVSSFNPHPFTQRYIPGTICYKNIKFRDTPCDNCIATNAMESRSVQTHEYSLDEETIEATASPIINGNDVEGVILRVDNITERKRVYAELQSAKDEAVKSDILKSAFLANMSHEIRTPLNSIVGFSSLMKTTEDEEEKEEFFKVISTNSDMLLRLINDILDLSKIEAGFIDFKIEELNITSHFEDLALSFGARMRAGVEFIYEKPNENCVVYVDKNRVTQIVSNFVTNAIKFTEKGFIKMEYTVTEKGIKISVTDTGIGISEENKLRVFGRFEKLNDFAQGTGLGLSICKSIIQTVEGEIGVDSEEGKGSTFWVTIPCRVNCY